MPQAQVPPWELFTPQVIEPSAPTGSARPPWEAYQSSGTDPVGATQPVQADVSDQGFTPWSKWATTPLLDVNRDRPTSALGGIWQAVKETGSEFTTPLSLGSMAALGVASAAVPAVGVLAGLGFGAYSMYNMWQEGKEAWNAQGPERWYHATNAAINLAMSQAAFRGGEMSAKRGAIKSFGDLVPDTSTPAKLARGVKSLFNPASLSEESKKTSLLMRQGLSDLDMKRQQMKDIFQRQSAELDKTKQVTPGIQRTIDALKQVLQDRIADMPDNARNYVEDLQAPGNVIDQHLAKIFEADKLRAYAGIVSDMEKNGFGKQATRKGQQFEVFNENTGKTVRSFRDEGRARAYAERDEAFDVRSNEAVPEDWQKISAPEFRYIATEEGIKKAKNFYAPSEVADLINNHLSAGIQGWRVAGPLYDMYRGAGNLLNQLQLGFSLFHGSFATFDSMASGVSYGLRKLISGQYAGGVGKMLEGATPYYTLKTYLEGAKAEKAWLASDESSEVYRMLDPFMKAGGRTKQDPFYYMNGFEPARKAALKAWRDGDYGRSFIKGLAALPELFAYPMMEKFIPRMKIGLFLDMAKFEMEKARQSGLSDWTLRDNLAKTWDSVDNRLGQVVYDNMFMDKAMKQMGMASIRSLGWNMGTFRELGGGVTDWAKLLTQPFKVATARNPQMTWKMAYTMTLPFMVGLYGGMMHYAMTGSPPETIDDYYFPKTASGNRISIPSYMKEVVEFYKDPWQTVKNKLHPLAKMIFDTIENSDFRNVHITEENPLEDLQNRDLQGLAQLFKDEVGYFGKQLLPFGMVGYQRSRQEGATPGEAAAGFIGFPPAPQRVVGSAFEQAARRMISAGSPEGGRTQLQAARSTARLSIEDRMRQGRDFSSTLEDAINQGLITPKDLNEALQDATTQSPTAALGKKLSIPDFVKAFNLATYEEQQQLMPILKSKVESAIGNMPPAQQADTIRALDRLRYAQPKALPPPPG